MDELDTRIIGILQKDGRASNASIARQVGVSEGTVRRRLKRLVQDQYIKIVAFPDPVKMGFESEAIVGVQVDPDKVDLVADKLAELKEVNWVAMTTGEFDIFIWVTVKSPEALGVFIRTKVGIVAGVRRTETFVNLSNRKRGYGIAIS